eukprot:CAMPEP_0178416826 /NCGR_PEP_ID=MMETSP0689_2-20121128/24262_1 /TAXON_ID=160604 /ORGANISM="Amphidinium massartii, Strain CS-259" /LENGTH=792 /DNA_ID=CAMNT_0020038179 /DNA_START=93 /DNA_END=2471 /DNA_ORIENTATION=-
MAIWTSDGCRRPIAGLVFALLLGCCVLHSAHAEASGSWRSLLPLRSDESMQSGRQLTAAGGTVDERVAGFKLADSFGGVPGFHHGVASGDPLATAVVIWTRYTPVAAHETIEVEFRIAPFPPDRAVSGDDFSAVLTEANPSMVAGSVMATNESDWIVKIDVGDLQPGTSYAYGFAVVGGSSAVSVVGTRKTAPEGHVEQLRYALFSCAHWTFGYFHPYNLAATIADLDFWVHVGDYIYEKGDDSSYNGDARQGWEPAWETETLQDYRLRYAQYRTDEALQTLHRRAPLIAVWDDHEFVNNNWARGAVNHEGDEASYIARARAAAQAYVEWLPIRRSLSVRGILDDFSITQVIEWGDLATIVGLDTRVAARSEEPTWSDKSNSTINMLVGDFGGLARNHTNVSSYTEEPLRSQFEQAARDVLEARLDPSFEMLGGVQLELLENAFNASKNAGKPWQIFAGATMMAPLRTPDFENVAALDPLLRIIVDYAYTLGGDSGHTAHGETLTIGEYMRIISAAATFQVPFATDDFNGFAHERNWILEMLGRSSNNPIILGGDLHESQAWTLYENADLRASTPPVTVNIGCPSVTSPSLGDGLYSIFSALGSQAWPLLTHGTHLSNPGLQYLNGKDRGFVAMTVTHTEHVAEFILMNDAADSEVANAYGSVPYGEADAPIASPLASAPFYCSSSFRTLAGQRGSLEPLPTVEGSCMTTFDSSRPLAWSSVLNPSITTDDASESTTVIPPNVTLSSVPHENMTTTSADSTTEEVSSARMSAPAGVVLLPLLWLCWLVRASA